MESYQRLESLWEPFKTNPETKHMVSVSSGTAALHVALEALELKPGSEVIIPDYTMVACARAVTMAGLKPVFVDCGPDLLMNVRYLLQFINENTSAIMPVHIYGRLCNMKVISEIAREHGLKIIEDCAESQGASHGYPVDASCWSFYRNKIIHGEEGGMIAFKETERASVARQIKCMGFINGQGYKHRPRGFNARLSNANATLISHSIEEYSKEVERRKRLSKLYQNQLPREWYNGPRQANWVHDIRIKGMVRARQSQLLEALRGIDVEGRPGFFPMSVQEEYKSEPIAFGSQALKASCEVIYLPLDKSVSDVKVKRACNLLKTFK